MEKILFSDTFTKNLKNTLTKIPPVVVDDPIFRLHYKFTGLALLFASFLVSGYEFFGDPIMCIQQDDIPKKLLNTYCWIEGTFTLPNSLSKTVGEEVVYPGVDQHKEGDEVTEHAYYQWVCFVLLLQSFMFCIPRVIWRTMESGRLKALIQKLDSPILKKCDQETCAKSLANYFQSRRNEHHYYALKFVFCEFLNFVNVVGQIYFIDKFLSGQFTRYGIDVVKYVNEEQLNRTDPMIRIFPRITKCTFHKFGSSGTVQKHDALCLLPLNILNEKIFVVMWFWFVILAILGGCLLIYRIVIMVSGQARFLLLTCVTSLTSRKDIKALIPTICYGDWFLLYLLADNIDNLHFRQLVLQLKPTYLDEKPGPFQVAIDDVDNEKKPDYMAKGTKVFPSTETSSLIDNNESSV